MNRLSLLIVLGVSASSRPAAASDLLAQLDGWWDTSLSATCTATACRHRLAEDGKSYESMTPVGAHLGDGKVRSSITCLIEKTGRNVAGEAFVRARIPDEISTDAAGNKVAWDLVFTTVDDICWHRTDRDESSCVQPARRCRKQ